MCPLEVIKKPYPIHRSVSCIQRAADDALSTKIIGLVIDEASVMTDLRMVHFINLADSADVYCHKTADLSL